jgi:hypothetical protein
MAGKTRGPGGEPAPADTSQPQQQTQDEGSGPANFGNINPSGDEDFLTGNQAPE